MRQRKWWGREVRGKDTRNEVVGRRVKAGKGEGRGSEGRYSGKGRTGGEVIDVSTEAGKMVAVQR